MKKRTSKLLGDLFYLAIIIVLFILLSINSGSLRSFIVMLITFLILSWIFGWRRLELIGLLMKIWPSQAKDLQAMEDIQKQKFTTSLTSSNEIFKPADAFIIFIIFVFIFVPLFLIFILPISLIWKVIVSLILVLSLLLLLYFCSGKVIIFGKDSIKLSPVIYYLFTKRFKETIKYKQINKVKLIAKEAVVSSLSHNYEVIFFLKEKRIQFDLFLLNPSQIIEVLSLITNNKFLKNKIERKSSIW